ncbi:hypothetical protein FACS18945_3700 [Bacteroidia bacterium]|nr:hypothetical protein FACS18945_3700 [Bacteroidia bacterium]
MKLYRIFIIGLLFSLGNSNFVLAGSLECIKSIIKSPLLKDLLKQGCTSLDKDTIKKTLAAQYKAKNDCKDLSETDKEKKLKVCYEYSLKDIEDETANVYPAADENRFFFWFHEVPILGSSGWRSTGIAAGGAVASGGTAAFVVGDIIAWPVAVAAVAVGGIGYGAKKIFFDGPEYKVSKTFIEQKLFTKFSSDWVGCFNICDENNKTETFTDLFTESVLKTPGGTFCVGQSIDNAIYKNGQPYFFNETKADEYNTILKLKQDMTGAIQDTGDCDEHSRDMDVYILEKRADGLIRVYSVNRIDD